MTTIFPKPEKLWDSRRTKGFHGFCKWVLILWDVPETRMKPGFLPWRPDNSDSVGRWFESSRAHHADALLESRAFFFCPAFGKAAPGAPSGMRTARPAGQRPGRFQQSCGLLESARVPAEPGWRNGSSAPSPSGRDHASRGRSHSPRGEVAKNAPQEHFLHTPADGAPKKRLAGKQGVFLMSSL